MRKQKLQKKKKKIGYLKKQKRIKPFLSLQLFKKLCHTSYKYIFPSCCTNLFI